MIQHTTPGLVVPLKEIVQVGPLIDANVCELLSDFLFEVLHTCSSTEACPKEPRRAARNPKQARPGESAKAKVLISELELTFLKFLEDVT